MGRPVNKRYFGANSDDNLKVQFNNGTASVPGFIVKQKGASRFLCQDADGNTAVCRLVAKAAGDLAEGEMSITVKLDDTSVGQITKIAGRKITVGGNSIPWNFSTSTTDNAVQVEEAGTDEDLTDNTDLEGDESL
jgi:hypothetical protein